MVSHGFGREMTELGGLGETMHSCGKPGLWQAFPDALAESRLAKCPKLGLGIKTDIFTLTLEL